MIKNVNTIEEYRSIDKAMVLNQAARTVSALLSVPAYWNRQLTLSCRYSMRLKMAPYTLVPPY